MNNSNPGCGWMASDLDPLEKWDVLSPHLAVRRMGGFARSLSATTSRLTLDASDLRLASLLVGELVELVADSPPKFISVDVFDTLLLRNDKCEARRFWEISERVRQRLADSEPRIELLTTDLFVARYLAIRAGYSSGDSPVEGRGGKVLHVLETQVDLLNLPSSTTAVLLEIELDYEALNLKSNDFLVAALQEALGTVRLLGLTDAYFGAQHIDSLVDRVFNHRCRLQGLFPNADVSFNGGGEYDYRLIADAMKTSCADILHIGHDVHSDIVRPYRAGCRALLFPVTHAELKARGRDLDLFLDERRQEDLDCEAYATS
jgi:hypothetical protein